MQIFNDRAVRLKTGVIVVVLAVFVLISQLTVTQMADDFKKSMIAHDYALAGYLSQQGMDGQQIILSFTASKSPQDETAGAALLSTAAYAENTDSFLLPDVARFQDKYRMTALAYSAVFVLFLLAVLYRFARKRDRKYQKAERDLHRFMNGNTAVRLDDQDEDSLSRLFLAVNTMATSLTAHIAKEKQNREFLKETISDISHQLKTPLAALEMYNTIIIEENTGNAVVEDFTVKIGRELHRMEDLTQNLLKLAKLDAGTIELDQKVYHIKEFLEKCLATFSTRAAQEGKSLRLACGDDPLLRFDPLWLTEAVENIIKNALDHTQAGDCIEISCEETVVATEVRIKDNGPGIHPDDIHHIFKRFYRSRYSQDRQGVGIGLALAQAIIEKHGGTITVQSEPGKGAAFHLIFPKLTNV